MSSFENRLKSMKIDRNSKKIDFFKMGQVFPAKPAEPVLKWFNDLKNEVDAKGPLTNSSK